MVFDVMGRVTRVFPVGAESVETECWVYAATDLSKGESVKRIKITRALWDTGASCSLVSARLAKALGLEPVGKMGVSGYNRGVDVRDAYLVHIGLPTRDIVTYIGAMECDSEDYDVVIGMDVIGKGDFAVTNGHGEMKFSFQIPSVADIDFTKG